MRRRQLIGALGTLSLTSCPVAPALASVFSSNRYDVVVVGAGGAGLAAAVRASELGAGVLLLEKQESVGGNTLISGGFLGVPDPLRQEPYGISDSQSRHFEDIYRNGGELADPGLVRALVDNAPRMLSWLEELGVRFKDEVIEIYGSHYPRCHQPTLPNGTAYVRAFSRALLKNKVAVSTDSAFINLVRSEDGRLCVIYQKDGKMHSAFADKGVILAAGGFGANPDLIARYSPELSDLTTDNGPGSTGEVLMNAADFGCALTGMNYIQCLPGLPRGGKIRVRFHNDTSRFIFIDQNGHRFVDEAERRDILTEKILSLPEKRCFCLIDDEAFKSYDLLVQRDAVRALETGDAFKGYSLEEIAVKTGIPKENLVRTVAEFNRSLSGQFGRRPIAKPPYWVSTVSMTVHYTMGGLKIGTGAECLDNRGVPIEGLYAAGEITGGVHGKNRIGANGLCDAFTFGMIAGESAVDRALA